MVPTLVSLNGFEGCFSCLKQF